MSVLQKIVFEMAQQRRGSKVKYYEFCECGAYALIAAGSEKEAKGLYETNVCRLFDGEEPKEVTEFDAMGKVVMTCMDKAVLRSLLAPHINCGPNVILVNESLL